MADEQKSQKGLGAVLTAVVVALIAGSSAPWWSKYIWPEPEAVASDTDASNSLENTTTAPFGDNAAVDDPPIATQSKPHTEMGALEFNTNRQGADLNSGDEVRRADDCSSLCAQDNRCQAMTFVQHPNGVGGICWLKNVAKDPLPQPGMTSAAKVVKADN
jgi:hypothetical protein